MSNIAFFFYKEEINFKNLDVLNCNFGSKGAVCIDVYKKINTYKYIDNYEEKYKNSNFFEKYINNVIPAIFRIYIETKDKKIFFLDILKYKVLSEDININKYQTVDEGIEGRIIDNITKVTTYEELIQNIKTKRYTYNKISRMLLHILTSFTKEEASNIDIDYIRVLGFTTKGQEYLSKIKKNITIPIITGYKKNISKVLDIEYRVTKIYSLFTSNNLIKKEYQIKPIIKENND